MIAIDDDVGMLEPLIAVVVALRVCRLPLGDESVSLETVAMEFEDDVRLNVLRFRLLMLLLLML